MTDKRNNRAGKGLRNYGDIRIRPEGDSFPKEPARRKTKSDPAAPLPTDIKIAPRSNGSQAARTRKTVRAQKKTFPYLVLLLPVAVFLLYFVGALYLVPVLIQGPLAKQLSQRLNRPVTAKEVFFSPLTFRLHLAGIKIGTDSSRKDDPELCTIAEIDTHVLPKSLLQGKVVLENMHIDQPEANLIRYPDGGYNVFPARPSGSSEKDAAHLHILPPWLFVHGLLLTDGNLRFHDISTGGQHHISKIKIGLPAERSGKTGTGLMLSAMVNTSPILLRGQRHTATDGKTETRLTLQLKNLDPQQYLSSLPGAANALTITGGNADAVLEVTLRDQQQTGNGPVVTGTISTSGLELQAKNNTFQLKTPAAQMVIRAEPFQGLYAIEKLTLDTPELILSGSQPSSLKDMQTRIASALNPAGISIAVDRLLIDQGSLTLADHGQWRDIHLLLTGFRNKAAARPGGTSAKPASLSLHANRGVSSIAFQGQVEPSLTLSGKIFLQNMGGELLQTLLPLANDVRFSRGQATLKGELLAQPGGAEQGAWKITDSSLLVGNFSLLRKNSLLVAGKEMNGQGCNIQFGDHPIFCRRLSFDRADFAAGAAVFLQDTWQKGTADDLPFALNNLNIKDSTVLVPLSQAGKEGKAPQLKLSELSLQLTGMQQEQHGQNNLKLQAAVGKQGSVELSGIVQKNGRGAVQLRATDIDISSLAGLFTDWLAPQVQRGTLQLTGRIEKPGYRFRGSFQLDDFAADNKAGPSVRWQQATGTEVTARPAPFSAAIKNLSLQQPSIQLSADRIDLRADFLTLFRQKNNAPSMPPVTVEQCTIDNGNLSYKSVSEANYLPVFTEVKGTISPLQPGTQASFNLSGKMDTADFTVKGSTGINTSGNSTLQVNRFPLARFNNLFTDHFKIDVQSGTADWSFSSPSPGSGRIQLTGITPLAGSDFSLVLALLTDEQGSFSLPISAQATADPAGLIGETVAEQLRRIRLQSVISPRLVLNKLLPELLLPQTIEFLPGETVPDFMEGLEDYAALLELRPHLGLVLQGSYDEKTDRQYLLQILQEAADAKRELENLRREQLRTKLLAVEEQRLAALEIQGKSVNKDKLHQIEQQEDLQPLPRNEIQLPDSTLQNLARQRAEVLWD